MPRFIQLYGLSKTKIMDIKMGYRSRVYNVNMTIIVIYFLTYCYIIANAVLGATVIIENIIMWSVWVQINKSLRFYICPVALSGIRSIIPWSAAQLGAVAHCTGLPDELLLQLTRYHNSPRSPLHFTNVNYISVLVSFHVHNLHYCTHLF